MTIRVGKLNGKNLNYLDHDVSSIDYATIHQGVIEGMQVVNGFVEVGRALVAVTRTNMVPNQKFFVHAEVTTKEAIDTTGTKKVWLEVNKQFVNDGTLATEPNGTEIARIMTGANFPNPNETAFIPLAEINGGVITDRREKIAYKEGAIKHQNFTLKGTGAPAWTKLGTFEGDESSRIHFRFLGGAGFGANDANAGGVVMEAILTIGNGQHTRNFSGFFTKIFGGSNIFTELRVFRNSVNSWDISVLHESFAHKTIVQVAHSGTRFIPNFQNQINTPNPSGDTIYNITEYKGNAMDIGGLQEIQEPTNIYDFFPLKEFGGGNKKVTLENLRKWVLRSMQ